MSTESLPREREKCAKMAKYEKFDENMIMKTGFYMAPMNNN